MAAAAIGAWSGLGGVAIVAGPLIGGYLISAASWRWIFFINVPIAAAVVALGARHIPESRDPDMTGKLDYGGALAAVVFLCSSRAGCAPRAGCSPRPRSPTPVGSRGPPGDPRPANACTAGSMRH